MSWVIVTPVKQEVKGHSTPWQTAMDYQIKQEPQRLINTKLVHDVRPAFIPIGFCEYSCGYTGDLRDERLSKEPVCELIFSDASSVLLRGTLEDIRDLLNGKTSVKQEEDKSNG